MAEINEIVSQQAIESVLKAAKGMTELDNAMIKFLQDQEKYKRQAEDVNKTVTDNATKTGEYAKILNKAAEDQNKLTATAKALAAQQKQLTDTEAKLVAVNTQSNQKLTEQKLKLQEAQKAMVAKTKANQAEEGSLVKMRQKLSELTAAYDASGKRTKAAAQEIASLSKEIEIAENETNRFQRGVGGYANQMKALIPGLMNGSVSLKQFGAAAAGAGKAMLSMLLSPVGLVIAAISAFSIVVGKAVKQAEEYQFANAELAGVLGVTRAETMELQKESQRLGATTSFTATEVANLQIEYARLGFAKQEIIDMSKATIDLSVGAKAATSDTATFIGGTLRAFGLASSEATRVADVTAKALNSSALNFEKISTGLGIVGPAANAVGESVESTAAKLGKLADANIDASTAATSLRNIYIELSKKGLTYDEAMKKIASSQDKLGEANKLFGKRGAVAALVLSEQAAGVVELTEKLNNASGAAQRMSDEQLNTIEGSKKLLESAWSGFLFQIEDGNGVISTMWKGILDGLTAAITWLTESFASIKKGFTDTYNASLPLRGAIEIIKIVFLNLFEVARVGFGEVFNFISGFASAFKAIVTGDFKALPGILKDTLIKAKDIAKDGAKEIGEDFKEAWNQTKNGKIIVQENAKETVKIVKKMTAEEMAIEQEKADAKEELSKKEKAAAKEKAAYEKKLADTQFKIASDAAKQEYDMQLMLIQATSKSKEEAENRTFEFKKQSLLKTLDLQQLELDSFKGNELEKLAIQERINKTRYDLEKVGMEERIKLNEEGIKKMEPIKKKELGLEKGKLQEIADISTQNAEQEIIRQEQTAEQKKQIIEASTDGVIQIQGALFDFMDAKYQGDLQRLEQKNAAGLISDQEYAKQKAEIEIKQAKASRLKAIFEATIGTAQAVISALQTKPFLPLGLIMAATAGVVGGLQIASILSQPLPTMPAFAEGTDNAPEQGLFGEKGRELMRTTGGEIYLANEPTVFAGNKFKGAKIWNNDETEYIMNRTREPQFGQPTRTDDRILRGLNSVEKAIKDKPVFIFDKEKNVVGMVRGSHTERYINRLKLNQ